MPDLKKGDRVRHSVTKRDGKIESVDQSAEIANVLFGSESRATPVPFEHIILLMSVAASAPGYLAKCRVCQTPNEYQDGPFTCWQCAQKAQPKV